MDIIRRHAVIDECQRQNADNRQSPRIENDHRQITLFRRMTNSEPANYKRQHKVIGDHNRQRHASDDDHRCRRRKPAEKGYQRKPVRTS